MSNQLVFLYENDLVYMLPEIFLLTVIMILIVLGVFFDKQIVSLGKTVLEVLVQLSILGFLLGFILVLNSNHIEVALFNYQILKNEFTSIIIGILLLGGLFYFLMCLDYIKKEGLDSYEYIYLISLSMIGFIVLVSANDLLVIYLGIELQSLCLYVLAAYKQNSSYSTEAGLKYSILGAFSSGLFLFGISLFYGFTGLINLTDIELFFSNMTVDNLNLMGIKIGLLFILIGLLFKIGAVPFHMWLPDVYSGSSTMVLAFFSIIPKIVLFSLISKLYLDAICFIGFDWLVIFVYTGLLSVLVGGFGGLYQNNVKRLIAYSGIGHTGFLLLGLSTNSVEGLHSVFLYLLIYMVILINFFAILLSVRNQSTLKLIENVGSFGSVYRSNRLLGLSLVFLLFSIAGIPPLAGFYSKLYVFFAVIKEGYFLVSIIGILLSVVGSVYYLRLIKVLLFGVNKEVGFYAPVGIWSSYVIVYSSLFSILFCFYSTEIINYIYGGIIEFLY